MPAHTEGYIQAGDNRLHYLQVGQGSKLLLAFHGYGSEAKQFLSLAAGLANVYTTIAINLPHYGNSHWEENGVLHPDDVVQLIDTFCSRFNTQQISLLGYSIGGRIALKIAEAIPGRIEKIVLLAPDGLRFNRFYHFFTMNSVGKWLFKDFLVHPGRYTWLLNIARDIKIVSASRYKFSIRYIQTAHSRSFLLRVWPCLKLMVPGEKKLKAVINKYKIPVIVFMGKHDSIIPLRLGYSFCKGLDTANMIVLDKGHHVLDADTLPQITQALDN